MAGHAHPRFRAELRDAGRRRDAARLGPHFPPESSRIARLASGGSHGFAQALFQVGGNFGSALGPLAAAFVVLPRGQHGLAWFALAAMAGIVILTRLGTGIAATPMRAAPPGPRRSATPPYPVGKSRKRWRS